jgi:hypothetical protein
MHREDMRHHQYNYNPRSDRRKPLTSASKNMKDKDNDVQQRAVLLPRGGRRGCATVVPRPGLTKSQQPIFDPFDPEMRPS